MSSGETRELSGAQSGEASSIDSLRPNRTTRPLFNAGQAAENAAGIRSWIANSDASDWNSPIPASSSEVERFRNCLTRLQTETRELWEVSTHTIDPESLKIASWSDGTPVGLVLASHLSENPIHHSFLYVLDLTQCKKMFVEYEATQVMVALDTKPKPTQFNLVHHNPDHRLAEYRFSKTGHRIAKYSPEQIDAVLFKGNSELQSCTQSLQKAPKGSSLSSLCDLQAIQPYAIRSFTWLRIYDFSPYAGANFDLEETGGVIADRRILHSPAGEAVVTEYFHTNQDPYLISNGFVEHIMTKQ